MKDDIKDSKYNKDNIDDKDNNDINNDSKKSIINTKKVSLVKDTESQTDRDIKLPNMVIKNIGVYDPEGFANNPFTGLPYENLYSSEIKTIDNEKVPATYINLAKIWSKLLVYEHRTPIIECIYNNRVSIITASTGIGKTVIIPKLALHLYDYKEKVITTIPKKITTINTADFAAKSMDTKLGDQVGYFYKGDNKSTDATKLIFTTTGSLLSRITGNDPLLKDYKCIIIDEAHERSTQTDQLIMLVRNAMRIRDDLKLIIMSATIGVEIFRQYFAEFKTGEYDIQGKTFPVKEHWAQSMPADWYALAVEYIMKILASSNEGDILIFGKSLGDGIRVCSLLEKKITEYNKNNPTRKQYPFCAKLASGATREEQDLAVNERLYMELKHSANGADYTRKVVVSTNVAESSITINGIVFVIDSGYEFTDSYNPRSMVRCLVEAEAPQSSLIQRKGRAGRTREGYCFHLYTKNNFDSRPQYPTPSIQKSDITNDILDLLRMKTIRTVANLRSVLKEFIAPPSEDFIGSSLRTLEAVGAINTVDDSGHITKMGFAISKFRGLPVGLARSIIASYYYGCVNEICDIVGLFLVADGKFDVIFQEPRKTDANKNNVMKDYNAAKNKFFDAAGDHFTFLRIMNFYKMEAKKLQEEEPTQKNMMSIENIDIGAVDMVMPDDEENINEDNIKVVSLRGGARKNKLEAWCRSNFIHGKRLALAAKYSKEFKFILNGLIRENKKQVDKSHHSISPNQQDGGKYRTGEYTYEYKIINLNTLQERVMFCLLIGNQHCIAKSINSGNNKGGGTYIACFPKDKINTKIAQDSTLKKGGEYILYGELFQTSLNSKNIKANIVSNINKLLINRLNEVNNKHPFLCNYRASTKPQKQSRKSKPVKTSKHKKHSKQTRKQNKNKNRNNRNKNKQSKLNKQPNDNKNKIKNNKNKNNNTLKNKQNKNKTKKIKMQQQFDF